MNKPLLSDDARYFLKVLARRVDVELGSKTLADFPIDEAREKVVRLLSPDEGRIRLPDLNVKVSDSVVSFIHQNETVELAIKIYEPTETDEALAIIVYFHGGGFALGDAGFMDFGCQYLAAMTPARVISVDYRRSPEHTFPTAHYDAYLAMRYIAQHPALFKSNGHLIVAGDSAGGNLAASVCHLAKASQDVKIDFQFLIYPWTNLHNSSPSDIALARGYYLELATVNWMRDLYIRTADDISNPLASPLLQTDFTDLPPALIVVGNADLIHDDAKAYADKIRQAGGAVEFKEFSGVLHDFCALPTFYHAALEAFDLSIAHIKKICP